MNRHKRYYPEESDQILFELELKFLIMAIERRVKFINDANLDDKDNIRVEIKPSENFWPLFLNDTKIGQIIIDRNRWVAFCDPINATNFVFGQQLPLTEFQGGIAEEPPKMTNLGLFCPKGLFQMVF